MPWPCPCCGCAKACNGGCCNQYLLSFTGGVVDNVESSCVDELNSILQDNGDVPGPVPVTQQIGPTGASFCGWSYDGGSFFWVMYCIDDAGGSWWQIDWSFSNLWGAGFRVPRRTNDFCPPVNGWSVYYLYCPSGDYYPGGGITLVTPPTITVECIAPAPAARGVSASTTSQSQSTPYARMLALSAHMAKPAHPPAFIKNLQHLSAVTPDHDMTISGPALWAELHQADPTIVDRAWINAWLSRVPCGQCRNDFLKIIRLVPPAYSDQYRQWTVQAHNMVRIKLGQHPISLAQAAAIWNWPEFNAG